MGAATMVDCLPSEIRDISFYAGHGRLSRHAAMKAGFYSTDITPALGMERPGGYSKSYPAAIHDPLKVRAAVFDDGAATVAFAGIDTCLFQSPRIKAEIRAEVERRCGIPGDHILLAASHTH